MYFSTEKPIYKQVIEKFLDMILRKELTPEERIPSVRAVATQLEITPNTAMRAYMEMQQKGLIYNKRGIGYFLAKDAPQIALNIKKDQFLNNYLPKLFNEMKLMGISFEELKKYYQEFNSKYIQNEKNQ